MRRRRRLIAVSIVLLVALASAAYGDFVVTSDPGLSSPTALSRSARVLVSIRNTTGGPLTIDSITKSQPTTTSCVASIGIAPLTGTFPVALVANQQAQFIVSSAGFTAADISTGPPACAFDINKLPAGTVESFSVQFDVDPPTIPTWGFQPKLADFGSQSGFEIQQIFLENQELTGSAGYTSIQISDLTQSIKFEGGACNGLQTCPGSMVAAGQVQQFGIKCDPTVSGIISGTITVYAASAPLAAMNVQCTGINAGGATINIVGDTINIIGPGMATAAIGVNGMADWSMLGASLLGPDKATFSFVEAGCSPWACDFTASPRQLPGMLTIGCTPFDTNIRSATLFVQGAGGVTDTDTATVTCTPMGGGGPLISALPSPITYPLTAVDMTATPVQNLVVTNTGAGSLDFSVTSSSPEWVPSACTSGCSLVGNGSSTQIGIAFTPSTYGDRSANLLINSNAGNTPMLNVPLSGSGSGATLEITDPASPFEIDFGTIPRGAPALRPLALLAQGNVGVTVTATPPSSPFSVDTTNAILTPGVPGGFVVGCGSSSAGGPYTSTVGLSSTASSANTSSVSVRCTIADTDVEVTPTTFAFGELRVGAQAVDLPFTIRNPSSIDVTVHALRLSNAGAGLTLSPVISTDMTLGPGQMIAGTLTLTPTADADLAGTLLRIDVDSANLAFPITGKVVTPAAHVDPAVLELGTACVGTQVSGLVMMVNDGTATLTMERPTMDQAFTPVYQDPTTYPAPLLAGHSAMVGVTPSMSATGPITGTMTWSVDAPGAPFQIPVSLEYIATGTALSPPELSFGTLEVAATSPKRIVTLENCDLAPVTIRINGVTGKRGTYTAWKVEPAMGEVTVGAHQKLTLAVEFTPPDPGYYEATLRVDVGDDPRTINLVGVAVGDYTDRRSLYACDCSGQTSPSRGWPIAIAAVLLFRRRRRASRVSYRCPSGSS